MRAQVVLVMVVACGICSLTARADPLPGEILKFQQLPLNLGLPPSPGGAPFPGHDELSSAYPGNLPGQYNGNSIADDFADKFDTPVVHLRWWGSYLNNIAPPDFTAKRFFISFEKDVPVSATDQFSHPGVPLLGQVVNLGPLAPGSGTFTEKPIFSDGAPEQLYEYNAELRLPFPEQHDTVYWLRIVALLDSPNVRWGWHNRDYSRMDALASSGPAVLPGEALLGTVPFGGGTIPVFHFQDDAVSGSIDLETGPGPNTGAISVEGGYQPQHYIPGIDGPDQIGQFSKDMAFELYTVPEPGMIGLCGLSAIVLSLRRKR